MSSKKPAIPSISGIDPQLTGILMPMKENIEILEGKRNNAVAQLTADSSTATIISTLNSIIANLYDSAAPTLVQTDWVPITLLNGWANYGSGWASAAYRIVATGEVQLRGLIANASAIANTISIVAQLPYHPKMNQMCVLPTTTPTFTLSVVLGEVLSSGVLNYYGSYAAPATGATAVSWMSLDTIRFTPA